ncbi:MAG TPA: transcription elongation factor GreA [Candidatus Paceibacterota bacterium]|nr:transcription elongation factor GreA [Candidatus Paceibacterota bacterium]
MSKYYLTKERFEELKKELEELKTVKRLEVADNLKRSKEYGDLSENAEYAEAREEQNRVEGRIFELEEMLKKVSIIEEGKGNSDAVHIGSQITVKKDGKTFNYTIVGFNESKPEEGKISNESPIGKAMLGRAVGDKVTVKLPAGETMYEIVKIG